MRPSPVGLAIIAVVVALALVAGWALATRSGGSDEVSGPTFWVATNGNDSAAGSEADPWKTIQHAASTVPSGATVYVRDGVYHEVVDVEVSGNAEDGPIVFRHAPGSKGAQDYEALGDELVSAGFVT